jgi:glycosyltransferase involved in cell wall biosynthesis
MKLVDVVLPVFNEERDLSNSVETLRRFLPQHLGLPWQITIADNGSTDETFSVAQALADRDTRVHVVHLPEKGRGRALKKVWLESSADILTYMDIDLSTNLNCFPPLVAAIAQEGYDLAVGSRLAPSAKIQRSLRREVISRSYVSLIRALFWTRFSDAQCGFKAISRPMAQALLPHVLDPFWFFDTELLIIAEKRGFFIKEIPVTWIEDPDTRVRIVRTAIQDLCGLLRLRIGGLPQIHR